MVPRSTSDSIESPLRVLILEDSDADTDLLVRELKHCFADTFVWRRVVSMAEVDAALAEDPEVALCDVQLPKVDGREVIAKLRASRPEMAIIAVTGTLNDRQAAGLVMAGADDYLLKDRLGRLGGAIERTLRMRERQRLADALIEGQNRILTGVAMGTAVERTLEGVVRLIEEQAPAMRCSVLLLEGDRVRHGSAPSLPAAWNALVDGKRIGESAGSCGTAAFRGEDVVCVDIENDPLWVDYRAAALDNGLRASWSRPIFASDGSVLGTFAMYYTTPRAPTADERHLVGIASGLAAVALEKARTDASLGESRRRFMSLFESNPDAVFLIDPSGTITDVNPAGEKMMDAKSGLIRGQSIERFTDDIDLKTARSAFRTTLAGVSRSLEIAAKRHDGSVFRMAVHTIPIKVAERMLGVYAVCRDVTAERKLQAEYRLAAQALENTAEGVMIFDAEFRLVNANPAFEKLLGWTVAEVEGKAPDFMMQDASGTDLAGTIRRQLGESGVWRGEYQWRRKNGETFPALISFSAVRGQAGVVTHFVAVFSDVSATRHFEERLAFLAQHDSLTQLANREQFNERMNAAIAGGRRAGQGVGVVVADIDNFKAINDSLGHEAGDRLLQAVAARLRDNLDDDDLMARFSGDEFGVLMSGVVTAEDCTRRIARMMGCLGDPFLIEGHELYVTLSIGISLFPQDGLTGVVLLGNADVAMYRAKERGPNSYQFFSAEMNAKALDDLLLMNSMRTAVERGEFVLHYQARRSMRTNGLNGVEALIRWNHPERGMVSPGAFIPLAETTGLIDSIGEWALTEACRQGKAWYDAGHTRLRVAVNLSARQLQQPDFVERVKRVVTDSGFPPNRVELEITESMLMHDADRAAAIIAELHDFGMLIALDDFGTGYSSLSYLKKFTIDELKIDMAFVRGLPGDEDDAAIVKAIVAVGKSLGMRIVAEGIETEEQREFLYGLGCDEAQGYLLGRPVPADQVDFG